MEDGIATTEGRMTELRSSAKGWHGIQLAALGFIGLCGVIQTGNASDPQLLQWLAAILVLLAFALACAGIYLVGRVAWPLYGAERDGGPAVDEQALARAGGRLRRGLVLTFASVAS